MHVKPRRPESTDDMGTGTWTERLDSVHWNYCNAQTTRRHSCNNRSV